jgi:hypothetical protein
VILANVDILKQQLKQNGVLLLSGLLIEDKSDILSATDKLDLKLINTLRK